MKTFLSVSSAVLVAFITLPTALLAHEGHGLEATVQSFLHWLSSPFHVTMLFAGAAALLGVGLLVSRLIVGTKSTTHSSRARRAEG